MILWRVLNPAGLFFVFAWNAYGLLHVSGILASCTKLSTSNEEKRETGFGLLGHFGFHPGVGTGTSNMQLVCLLRSVYPRFYIVDWERDLYATELDQDASNDQGGMF